MKRAVSWLSGCLSGFLRAVLKNPLLEKILEKIEGALTRQGRRLFCWLPVALGLGESAYFGLKAEPDAAALCFLAFGAVSGVFLVRRVKQARSSAAASSPYVKLVYGAGLTGFCLGLLLAFWQAWRQPPMPDLPHEAVWMNGRVVESVFLPPRLESQPLRGRLTLSEIVFESPWHLNNAPLTRRLRVTLPARVKQLPPLGQKIRVRALVRPPSAPYVPGGRDPQREAWFAGLAGSGTAYSAPLVLSENSESAAAGSKAAGSNSGRIAGSMWRRFVPAFVLTLDRFRADIAQRLLKALPGQNGAVAATVLTGETGALSLQTRQQFAASGLAHLLAVAGLHLGMVMVFCAVAVRGALALSEQAALRLPCRGIALVCALAAGVGYVILTGAHLPGLRALGMAALATLALLLGRSALSMRSLALVALAFLLASPALVLNMSFQMSFAAVMALIAGYELCRRPLERLCEKSGFWRHVGVPCVALGLTSLLAGLGTLPISAAHFGVIQPWFVLANMAAVPLMGLWIMPLGLVSLALLPFHGEKIPLTMMGWGLSLVRRMAALVADFPGATLSVGTLSGGAIACMMVGLSVLCLWRGKGRLVGAALVLGALGLGLSAPRPLFLCAPDGRFVAVRAGESYKAGPGKNQLFRDIWAQETGLSVAEALPPSCKTGACSLEMGNGRETVLLVLGPHGLDPSPGRLAFSCQGVSLVVTLVPVRRPCPQAPFLTRASTRRDGAWAVYKNGLGLRRVSDREARGDRFWVPPPGFEGVPGLPMALSE